MALSIPPRRCMSFERLSKTTVRAMFRNSKTGDFLDKMTDDQWEIVSFDSQKKLACINVYANHGINRLNLTIPTLSVSNLN